MARNQEKAQSMLNRWVNWRESNEFADSKRPTHPSLSETLTASEHWRKSILKDIANKVSMIQNGMCAYLNSINSCSITRRTSY